VLVIVVGEDLGYPIPIAGRELHVEALVYPRRCVFEPSCLWAQFLKPRERDVEVILRVHLQPNLSGNERNDIGDGPLQFVPVYVGAFDDEVDDRAMGIERVHRCYSITRVWHERPQLVGRLPDVLRCERDSSMVGKCSYPLCHRARLVAVEGAGPVHDRSPGFCVRCGFAGEVAGIELRERGVDVVGVEEDVCRDLVVGVDLDNADPVVGGLGPVADRQIITNEDEALPAGRHDGQRYVQGANLGKGLHVRDFGSPTVPDAGVHHPSTIVGHKVVGQCLGHAVPFAGGEVRKVALEHSIWRVFQLRRRPTEPFKPRDGRVDVCLVENFAAIDHVAFDRHEVDPPPLGVKPLLRNALPRMGVHRSEVAQPMHDLDVGSDALAEVNPGI
jgi:hypothetical protein